MFRTMLVAATALLLFSACEKSGFSYDNSTNEEDVQYTLLDTFTIQMRTVQLDSIPTSGTATALTGGYMDPVFGRLDAGTYFRISLPPEREVDIRAEYDSIELIMRPNGYWYGDTLVPQQFRVYKLAQKLELPTDYYRLFSHQQFTIENMPWADTSMIVRPVLGEQLHIRLSDVKGRELFDMLRNKVQEVSTEDHFAEYFKGMAVRGNNNRAVFGFQAMDTSLYIRLHYHISTTEVEEKYFDFKMTNAELQFNEIQSDRSGTPLESLTTGPAGLPTTSTASQAYVQSITRTVARMDFPGIPALQELGKYGRIMRAELVLRPVLGTYSDYAMPPMMTLCPADNLHYVAQGDTLLSEYGTQYGNMQVDFLNPENTAYVYDVTEYCRALSDMNTYTYRGLLFIPNNGDYYTTFNRLVIGDGENTKYRAQLKVYYLLYK
ncbi:DUF4270 family protein [Chitinophaga cymbidii]|uniref:DUF4270 domain-containing protein n=1 Tax=Chitinophaga cymbidii TaxID=1096750 RepID=A0A512RL78_9BACT|nr:DUF4270 family protein [Chitinophaga cymbidii]GEP96410.1 hypothetical protein CCY01nite_26700 [Chitinophaga cymbidii]